MSRSRYVAINVAHIQHNFARFRQLIPSASILTMVKANAYGHGAVTVASALSDADAFGVATLDEAIELREAGIQQAIVVMTGFLTSAEYQLMVHYQLDCVIHDAFQLDGIEAQDAPVVGRFWLKLDTGMHRLGMAPEVFAQVIKRLQAMGVSSQQLILMTHMACADETQSPMSQQQWDRFEQATQGLDGAKSVANSALTLDQPLMQCDWVRVGYMLYGGSPVPEQTAESLGLLPAMTLHSQVVSVKSIEPGESVGYGATWVAERQTNIAVIAMGYGDGYPRHASEGTPVLINGEVYPLVGRVSMDLLTVDLGQAITVHPGDDVVLWGEGLPMDTIATHCGTIGYELMTQLTSRVQRVVITE